MAAGGTQVAAAQLQQGPHMPLLDRRHRRRVPHLELLPNQRLGASRKVALLHRPLQC